MHSDKETPLKLEVLSVVLARGGSKGIPRKSLLEIGDKSLIGYAIDEAVKSNTISRVVFSSDDLEMQQEAKKHGAEVLFTRPDELAEDTAGSWSVVQHAVKWLEENKNYSCDYVILLQPSTPFRTASHIDTAFSLMLKENNNSCISVREVDYPPHWMFWIDKNNVANRLFPEGENIKRRQDAPVAWQPNGAIYIISSKMLFDKPTLPNKNTTLYRMDWNSSINIDNMSQYEFAKVVQKKSKNIPIAAPTKNWQNEM